MSDAKLRAAALALSLVGIGVAGYLTWVHYAGIEPVCVGGSGGCERVQTSEYADLFGIPVAALGLVGYISIGLASLGRTDTFRLAAAALALAGAGFSLYLTYLELFVIEAICQWCVASAVLMCLLATVCTTRLLRSPAA